MDEGVWMCPGVFCGDAAIAYSPSDVGDVESAMYVTGNISVGVTVGIPINCSTVFRPCLMTGWKCTGPEALGQKNRPLSLAMQYDEVSIMWDWAASSGAAALALLKPECPHPRSEKNCGVETVIPAPRKIYDKFCMSDCKDLFDGLYYHLDSITNTTHHFYSSIAFMPTTWSYELFKITSQHSWPCATQQGFYLNTKTAYVQKIHLAKLYADKMDTLANERFTIINNLEVDQIMGADSMTFLKSVLSGKFMHCYKGYSCGFSLYDATYLAGMLSSLVFLKEMAEQADAMGDYALTGMFASYYQYNTEYDS